MSEQPVKDTPSQSLRDALWQKISSYTLFDEQAAAIELADIARIKPHETPQVERVARDLVHAARAARRKYGGVDALMAEYALSSKEGVVLMCLAEALLRVPDAETADKLIAEKIGSGEWENHVGKSQSMFVNASSWGLMLTGRIVQIDEADEGLLNLRAMVGRLGEPVIRQAMRQAMRIMGKQFVLGRTIDEAINRAEPMEAEGYFHSYDMLGEGAKTAEDAARYYETYREALLAVAEKADKSRPIHERPSLSVKLSALHPRFEPLKRDRAFKELFPRIRDLALLAKENDIGITLDAEEASRLTLSLEIYDKLLGDPALSGWNGLGLAVQAYSKRAYPVLEWLATRARETGRQIPVRLVKGAYWDTEIKLAQEEGLETYPVFTRKAATDTAYLACARYMITNRDVFYCQFATHNAHTVAAIYTFAGRTGGYEFQRLHGMGQGLYEAVVPHNRLGIPCRIYAPVGSHEDLLAYLVRRLLENGANSSFVNRLADDEAPVSEIIADPVEKTIARSGVGHPEVRLPPELFGARKNSKGLPLWHDAARNDLLQEIAKSSVKVEAWPLSSALEGKKISAPRQAITAPHDGSKTVGSVLNLGVEHVDRIVKAALLGHQRWDETPVRQRAFILRRAAELFEENYAELIGLIVTEAGKTLSNALSDIREAVDFLRYYADEAEKHFGMDVPLPGPTGERNTMRLKGRGVFVAISPWNFPLAIFTGQVAAALAAGNSVIAKPAEQTPLVAFRAAELLLKAGVPNDALHFLPGAGETIGKALVAHPDIGGIVFTGSNETAWAIQSALVQKRGAIIPFIAETGGINAMIVDSTALPEQAVRDIVRSAFDSAGQRCSALRLLYVQEEVADRITEMLKGAVKELALGDPSDVATDVGPVIDLDAKRRLEVHKAEMAKKAKLLVELPLNEACEKGTFVAPAVFELDKASLLEREVFGPVLHLVRYQSKDLHKVCNEINALGYGLTLCVHSRIERTVAEVIDRVRVGNIYVNRNQIGATVGSQPFGGEGLSGTGPKAGGPHYLIRFATERVVSIDTTASGGNTDLMSMVPTA